MMNRPSPPIPPARPRLEARSSAWFGVLFLALSLLAGPVIAEIPRATQQALQKAASEKLTIEILTVKAMNRVGDTRLVVTARALAVEESESGLEHGDTFSIRYTVPNRPDADASPSKVEKGKRYQAFLRKAGQKKAYYSPAASSGSFATAAREKP